MAQKDEIRKRAQPRKRIVTDEPFVWKEAQQEAFDKLKMLFTTAPVLAFPDNDCQFQLESDGSEFTIGAVLSILKANGILWPIIPTSCPWKKETTQLQPKRC